MKKMDLDQVRIVSYQDSISGELASSGYQGKTQEFWVHLEYFPREITEIYMLESGEERPHPQANWAYARGILLQS
ncbi:MAG TPA: hypothetical protein VHL60_00790 [Oxalicibacterium sp.]|jgi:hypothetical protein|nr:hypothetical protein [Oxalicibacterium sp.]